MTNYYYKTKRSPGTSSVHSINSSNFLFILFLTLAALFSSCQEEATLIGVGLLPGTDFSTIKSTDTIKVVSYTVFSDSVKTNNKSYSYLGGLYDPYFGNISADFVSQLRLSKKWSGKGAFSVDSVKLSFAIEGAKGTLETDLALQIFEIGEELSDDSTYYSGRDPRAVNLLATVQLPALAKDTITNFLLVLPNSVGEYLTRDTLRLNQEDAATDFRKFFKGVYITVAEGSGKSYQAPLLMALQFETVGFTIRVYYHYLVDATSSSYDFIINANSVRYNRYSHDYTTAEPDKKIEHIGETFRDTISYLKAFNGIRTKVRIPGLEYYKTAGSVSVNKARLTIPVFLDDSIYKSTTVPARILMSYKSSEGTKYLLPDYSISPSFFDGSFNSATGKYSFNITSFIQEYLEGRIPDSEMELYLSEGEYRNVILKANAARNPIRFEFVYTRF